MSVHDVTAVDEQEELDEVDELDEVEEVLLDSVDSDSEADSVSEGLLLASVPEASGGESVTCTVCIVIGGSSTGGIGGQGGIYKGLLASVASSRLGSTYWWRTKPIYYVDGLADDGQRNKTSETAETMTAKFVRAEWTNASPFPEIKDDF